MFKRTLALLVLLLLAGPARAEATAYFSGIDDLPLMPGMAENPDESVIFDKPGGRIVETGGVTASRAAAVREFYAAALPPLGWEAAGAEHPGRWRRGGETLSLNVTEQGGATLVRFTLTPAGE